MDLPLWPLKYLNLWQEWISTKLKLWKWLTKWTITAPSPAQFT